MVDSAGAPVGVIEIVSVEVIRLEDAESTLAREEGEGFADVGEWRAAHERFWSEEVIPRLPRRSGSSPHRPHGGCRRAFPAAGVRCPFGQKQHRCFAWKAAVYGEVLSAMLVKR